MNWNRVISCLLAGGYLIAAWYGEGGELAAKTALCLVLPLAAIWFPDLLGGYVGPAWGGSITQPTPGIFILIMGWVLLLLPVAMAIGNVMATAKS